MDEYVLIRTDTLRRFADNARRLGGVETELSTEQMLEIFSAVENGGTMVRIGEVELLAANWLDGEPDQYYQIVEIEGITENSLIGPAPDASQILILNDKTITFHFENEGGVVTAFATGGKPTNDYIFQVHITEVSE